MKQEVEDQVLKVVEANLPAAVGKTLQKRLEKIETLEEDLSTLKEELDEEKYERKELKKILEKTQSERDELRVRDIEVTKLEERLKEVKADLISREGNLEVDQMRIRLEASESKCAAIYDLTDRVFRNHVVRETVVKDIQGDSEYGTDKNGYTWNKEQQERGTIDTTRSSEDEE